LTKLIRSPCIYPLIKGFADVGTGQPQFDVVRFFDHRLLRTLTINRPTSIGKPTLIVVRRALAEVNAVLADATPVASFARFKALIVVFSDERTSFRPWVSVAMVKVQDSREKAMQRACYEEETEP